MALSQKNKTCSKVKLGRISQYTYYYIINRFLSVGFIRELKKLFGVKFQIYDAEEEDDYDQEIQEENEDDEIKEDFDKDDDEDNSLDELLGSQSVPK